MARVREDQVRLHMRNLQRLPAVRRVRDLLRSEIVAGGYRTGPLPREATLMLQYGVSRGVMRDVLALLRDEGLIERLQGAGTFVVVPKFDYRQLKTVRSMAEPRPRHHREPLHIERMSAPPLVAQRLEIAPGDEVVYFERRALLEGRPLSMRSSWLPLDVGERLVGMDDELRAQVYHLLENILGFAISDSELKIEATVADSATAPVLEVDPGTPLLLLERLIRGTGGRPLEFSYSRMRGDRMSLTFLLERSQD